MRWAFSKTACPQFFGCAPKSGELLDLSAALETVRPDGSRQSFSMARRGDLLESVQTIPEPHEFTVNVFLGGRTYPIAFAEHDHGHGAAHRDNNMRAAVVHVAADAAVSVLVIVGLLLARAFGRLWMDPLAGLIGAAVIGSWSYGLIRDTGYILLDMSPDRGVAGGVRQTIEAEGDQISDLHLWRLGPSDAQTREARSFAGWSGRTAEVLWCSAQTPRHTAVIV